MSTLPDLSPSRVRYALFAWLAAVVPSLAYFLASVAVGADTLHPPAGAFAAGWMAYSILGAPLLETALMLPIAAGLARLIPQRTRLQVVALAIVCALAHQPGGGWRQVFASLWPFLIYSITLATWLRRSVADAFFLTVLVHALYNATFFAAGALGALLVPSEN